MTLVPAQKQPVLIERGRIALFLFLVVVVASVSLVSGSDSECQVVDAVHAQDCDSASRTGSLGVPGGRRRLGLGLPSP